MGSRGSDSQRPPTCHRSVHPAAMVSESGFLSATVLVLAPHGARGKSGAGCRQASPPGLPAVVLANSIPLFGSVLAFAALKKLSGPPSLPGNAAFLLLRWTLEGNPHRGRGSGTAQTASSAAGILAAPQLDRPPRRYSGRVCWAVSLTSGNPSFVLRQCPQESVLLSRMWERRRPDPFHRAFPGFTIPPKHHASGTGTGARFHFSVVGADTRFLPTATAPRFGRGTVSGAARTAPSHHRRTGHRVRSRRKPTSPSGHPRLFVPPAARDRFDQPSRPGRILPACDLPVSSARPDRQLVRTQYRRSFPAPLVAAF